MSLLLYYTLKLNLKCKIILVPRIFCLIFTSSLFMHLHGCNFIIPMVNRLVHASGSFCMIHQLISCIMIFRSEERRVGKECIYQCDWSSDVCSSDLAFAWLQFYYPYG